MTSNPAIASRLQLARLVAAVAEFGSLGRFTRIMKIMLVSLVTVSLISFQLLAAGAPPKASPRFKARVTCFNGKIDSASSCSVIAFQPDGTLHATGKMTCGFPGQVSEVEWSFVERRGTNDIYRFTRRFPADTAAVSTTSKSIEFSDGRVVVFEDKFQVVVVEPPKK